MSSSPPHHHSQSSRRPTTYAILHPPTTTSPTTSYTASYFNSLTPPPNYVPGLSRGAIGFTTRSDVGPLSKLSQRKVLEAFREKGADALKEENLYGEYTKEDENADAVWNSIEERMKRRRKRDEMEGSVPTNAANATTPAAISSTFSHLKTSLRDVTPQQWMAIPESKNSSIQRRKFESYRAVPDTLIARAQQEAQGKDLLSMGEARMEMIQGSLERKIGDSVRGQTNVDAVEYMSGLATQSIGNAEIGDLKRARDMMRGLTTTNPHHAPGWIARARVEELAGKMSAARSIITEGCEQCQDEEDIWLEAARLHPPAEAKAILAEAVAHLPQSAKIWVTAAELEDSTKRKRRVLRKALKVLPQSMEIWKEAIELEEDDESARLMLRRAVECLPTSVEFALALARLETHTGARQVLNRIRKQVPNDPSIWVAAAQLEETMKPDVDTKNMLTKALKALKNEGVPVERYLWIQFAKQCEDIHCLRTCRAIVELVLAHGVAEHNLKKTFIEDANAAVQDEHLETARAIYDTATSILPKSKGLWKRYTKMESIHGTTESHIATLKLALKNVPDAELMWLTLAKTQFKNNDIEGARESLKQAFEHNAESDLIWLAAVAVEMKTEDYARCEKLLQRAREAANSSVIWMKCAVFYRNLQRRDEEKQILDAALSKFQTFDKLWVMRAQWEQDCGSSTKAQEYFEQGLKFCPQSVRLWLCAVKHQVDQKNFAQARALIDQAKLHCGSSEYIWLMSVRVETLAECMQAAEQNLARALQELPRSGMLWREQVRFETAPAKRKAQAVLAVRECETSPEVFCFVANIFWNDHVYSMARTWFNRALKLDYDNGDTWIQYYAFERAHGSEETLRQMLQKLDKEQPRHGEKWCAVSKDPKNFKMESREILEEAAKRFNLRNELDRMSVSCSTYCTDSNGAALEENGGAADE